MPLVDPPGPPADGSDPSPLGVVEIDLPSSTELVTVVRMIVAAACTATGALKGDRLDDLRWVTSEAITNAIEANLSAADGDLTAAGRVRARCEVGDRWVRLRVTDQGSGMSDSSGDVPDITHPDRLRMEGGFGIPLMQHLTRGVISFESLPGGTAVDLRVDE